MATAMFQLRQARMELKTTSDTKDLLTQAAAVNGIDLTAFVLGPAVEKARKVLSEHATITLTKEGQLTLARILNGPPEQPTEAMRQLMALPDLPTRRG
jgi:uncharacterized protein (DUF1778 family)